MSGFSGRPFEDLWVNPNKFSLCKCGTGSTCEFPTIRELPRLGLSQKIPKDKAEPPLLSWPVAKRLFSRRVISASSGQLTPLGWVPCGQSCKFGQKGGLEEGRPTPSHTFFQSSPAVVCSTPNREKTAVCPELRIHTAGLGVTLGETRMLQTPLKHNSSMSPSWIFSVAKTP